jgi:hypothetical protein
MLLVNQVNQLHQYHCSLIQECQDVSHTACRQGLWDHQRPGQPPEALKQISQNHFTAKSETTDKMIKLLSMWADTAADSQTC